MPLTKRTNPYYVAQDILSRRDHSEFELRTKMRRKHFNPDQINDVVAKLKKLNLVNDEKFTVMFVANTLLFKAVGPKYLSYKLKQKGITSSLIEAALAEAFPPGREAELAHQVATRWRRTHVPSPDKQNLTRHLISHGFSFDAIQTVISSYTPDV